MAPESSVVGCVYAVHRESSKGRAKHWRQRVHRTASYTGSRQLQRHVHGIHQHSCHSLHKPECQRGRGPNGAEPSAGEIMPNWLEAGYMVRTSALLGIRR